jgi:FdhD protein
LDPSWAELLQPERLCGLPVMLEAQQGGFFRTGGQHAAALVDREGRLELVREDVGRHNAVDKVIGARLRADRYPLSDALLLVSSRAGYEIAQKAVVARVPILASIGAPSRLACELAAELGLWLYGFVRRDRCTRYWPPPEGW